MKSKRYNPYNVKEVMLKKNMSKEEAESYVKNLKLRTSNTLESYIFKYGKDKGTILYNEKKSKRRYNPYSVEDNMKFKGMTKDEAENFVSDYKLKTSTSLEGFIRRHGEIEGRKKYEEKCKKDSFRNTLEGKIDLYGQEIGLIKYNNQNSKNSFSSSLEGKISKYGLEKGFEIHSEINKKRSKSCCKEAYIERYGLEKYNVLSEQRSLNKEKLILKYGLDKANSIIDKRNIYLNDPISYFKNVKGLSEKDSLIAFYKNILKGFYKNIESLDDSDMLDLIDDIKTRKEIQKSKKSYQASKLSLKYFIPLIKWLQNEYNLDLNDIKIGYKDSKEKIINYIDNNNRTRFVRYDFCIESLKIIIEFDGIFYHPPKDDSEKELLNWFHPFNINPYYLLEQDELKEKLAIKNGYKFYRFRSDENDILLNMKRIINENKENN